MRVLLASVLATVAALALAACGEKRDLLTPGAARPFNLVLDFFPNADHAGIYSALANGDFARAGLDVRPRVPADPSEPLKLLAAGRADMAISYEPELLLARDRGLKVVSVGALVQKPLTSLIAINGSHVTKVSDLAGGKVGTAGIPYQSAELQTVLAGAGVAPSRVQEVNVGFDLVPAMLSRKVSATLGGFWNYEGIQLSEQHKRPTVIPVDRAGVPTYDELVLVVREQEARSQGRLIRAFVQALARGEQRVKADPARAAQELVKANRDLDPHLQLQSIEQTLPVAYPSNPRLPFGYQDPGAWAVFGQWMLGHKLLSRAVDPKAQPYTNEFLPGQGL